MPGNLQVEGCLSCRTANMKMCNHGQKQIHMNLGNAFWGGGYRTGHAEITAIKNKEEKQ